MAEYAKPTVGGFYRHFKNKLYQVLNIAVHADTEEELVIYQALYGDFKVYARPLKDFMGEVDHVKYPHAMQKMRFVKVTFCKQEEVLETQIKQESKMKSETEPAKEVDTPVPEGVHPLLIKFLDAESIEERLEVFKEMQDVADQHMLDAVAASLDISLNGTKNLFDAYELIFDNLVTQRRYESNRRI